MKSLLRIRGSLPFLSAVFLNAFVDLGHKITVQNTVFKLYSEQAQVVSTAILNGLILLPFILLLSPAGFISDRFARARVMRACGWLAVALCGLVWLSYLQGWFWLAFTATFLLAAQSAVYSPAKFAFIKELFGKQRLAEANGLVASLSIIAILAGTFAFTIGFETLFRTGLENEAQVLRAVSPIGLLLLASSLLELIMMYLLPVTPEHAQPVETEKRFQWRSFFTGRLFREDLEPLRSQQAIRLSVVGLATFWGIGQVMLAAFPAYFKARTAIDNTIVIQGILACSGLGIALGAFFAGRISRDRIELGVLPLAALGIALGLIVLPGISNPGLAAVDFFAIGVCGGLFIVPLNAVIQFQARPGRLGKTLAANNWVQNIVMFSFLAITVTFTLLEISSQRLLYLIALVALVGFAYTLYQLPQSFLRLLILWTLRNRYKLTVQGFKNIPAQGGALLLGNHISWIDWAIVQMASPRPIRFVMIRSIYDIWYLKWFFTLAGCIPIEQGASSRKSLDTVRELLEAGELVCLFPEGTLSRTGHLVEFRRGYERACEGLSEAVPIIPFYLHGLWGSQFSNATSLLKQRSSLGVRRKVVVAFGEAIANSTPADLLKQRLFELSIHSWQQDIAECENLGRRWVQAAKQQGNQFALTDATGARLSGYQALAGSSALCGALNPHLQGQNIGLLLPASTAGALTNMAVLQAGRTLVNLNYTLGAQAIHAALAKAEIQTVVTSRRFLQKLDAKGFDLTDALMGKNIIELENLAEEISPTTKLRNYLLCRFLPTSLLKWLFAQSGPADATACILFSSGSEGSPKGVALSHKNIHANIEQTLHVLNPREDDVVLGNLPLFHAFGLTVTQFLPLLNGIPVVFHPDPTDALGAAKLITRHQATLMFGTSTFFRLYIKNRKVHPLMLEPIRLVVSGAEKLNAQVQQAFQEKFGKPVYEGYGATEATPVVSVNLPDQIDTNTFKVHLGARHGSVGMPLPGTSIRIVDPENFTTLPTGSAGMILIGGVQIMQGYLGEQQRTEAVIKELDGQRWYVTGDKGKIDEDGFLTILDRYSRFAKIAGEMISLAQVEQVIYSLCSDQEELNALEIALVNLPDEKRGERVTLLTNCDIGSYLTAPAFAEKGLSNLALPERQIIVQEIPKFASGKINYAACKKIAQAD